MCLWKTRYYDAAVPDEYNLSEKNLLLDFPTQFSLKFVCVWYPCLHDLLDSLIHQLGHPVPDAFAVL